MPHRIVKSGFDESIQTKYVKLLEIIPDIIYRIDTAGNFTFVNACVRNLGFEPEDLQGKHFSTIIHPDDVPRVSRKFVLQQNAGKMIGEADAPKLFDERRCGKRMTRWLEVRLVPKGWNPAKNGRHLMIGSLISVGEISSTGIYGEQGPKKAGEFVGTVGIIRDITDRKKDEEERKRLEQQFLQAQKLESLGLLAGGIAHDFKNLLTISIGYLEMALEKSAADQTLSLFLDKAMHALQRSKILTQQLLNFSKSATPRKKICQIENLIRSTTNLALGQSNSRAGYLFDEGLWPVEVDEGQIAQVIDNIVINARHAMPEGGVLDIKIRNRMVQPKDRLPIDPGAYLELSIIDHGIGIAPEHLPKIFDPFFTTKQDGSGLGLATSYFIVKKHLGHIWLESSLGKGTSVFILLPAHRPPVPAMTKPARQKKPPKA